MPKTATLASRYWRGAESHAIYAVRHALTPMRVRLLDVSPLSARVFIEERSTPRVSSDSGAPARPPPPRLK